METLWAKGEIAHYQHYEYNQKEMRILSANFDSIFFYWVIAFLYFTTHIPFHTCRWILTQMQQTTFENLVAKVEIKHNNYIIIFPFKDFSIFLPGYFQKHVLYICCVWESCSKNRPSVLLIFMFNWHSYCWLFFYNEDQLDMNNAPGKPFLAWLFEE